MDKGSLIEQFGLELLQAMGEACDPGLSHWAAGYAMLCAQRAKELVAEGLIEGFTEINPGIAAKKVGSREQAIFREGTSLVALQARSPWEAPDLARAALRSAGEAWICLRLTIKDYTGGGQSHWCCARVEESSASDFEPVWQQMSCELARAEVLHAHYGSFAGMAGSKRERLESLRLRVELDSSAGGADLAAQEPVRI